MASIKDKAADEAAKTAEAVGGAAEAAGAGDEAKTTAAEAAGDEVTGAEAKTGAVKKKAAPTSGHPHGYQVIGRHKLRDPNGDVFYPANSGREATKPRFESNWLKSQIKHKVILRCAEKLAPTSNEE